MSQVELVWRRSSRCSADKPQCVEVGRRGDVVLIRDSKSPVTGAIHATSTALRYLVVARDAGWPVR